MHLDTSSWKILGGEGAKIGPHVLCKGAQTIVTMTAGMEEKKIPHFFESGVGKDSQEVLRGIKSHAP